MPAPKKKPGKRKDYRPRLGAGLRKVRPDCVLKNLPPEQQKEVWGMVGQPGMTNEKLLARATEIAGRPISHRQLTSFRVWYRLCERAERLEDVLDALPEFADAKSGDNLRERGVILLMAEALERNAGDAFIAAARVHLSGRELQVNLEKFRHAVKTATEKALEEFAKELQGNTKALALFAQMKKAVEKAVGAAIAA